MIQKRKEKRNAEGVTPNFPALQLLHDPQTFGEKLYDYLNRYGSHHRHFFRLTLIGMYQTND